MKNINIAGQNIKLESPVPEITKHLWLGLLAEFDVMEFAMNGHRMLLLVANNSVSYSPLERSSIAQRIEAVVKLPAVFYFDNLPTYDRDRMVAKEVYFVVGDKFAYLPTLLASRRMSTTDMPTQFLPSTQYLLMFHLQGHLLNGLTMRDIVELTPYKYATIARSIQQLENLGLAKLMSVGGRRKGLMLLHDNKGLWEKALPNLISPIKRAGYLDTPLKSGLIGGIDALSHYSMLVGEECPTRVFTVDESNEHRLELTPSEDIQRVEIWKYPPIAEDGYVDRLSLYLTLSSDSDPRVEKELETMINSIPW